MQVTVGVCNSVRSFADHAQQRARACADRSRADVGRPDRSDPSVVSRSATATSVIGGILFGVARETSVQPVDRVRGELHQWAGRARAVVNGAEQWTRPRRQRPHVLKSRVWPRTDRGGAECRNVSSRARPPPRCCVNTPSSTRPGFIASRCGSRTGGSPVGIT